MNKITFKLLDGKPVPHVWTMPEPYNEKDYSGDQWKERAGLDIYNKAITHARENAVPVKEEFRDAVRDLIMKQQHLKITDGKAQYWTPDLTRDYDVDMEFEIETEKVLHQECMEFCQFYYKLYFNEKSGELEKREECNSDECFYGDKKVAITKQTKEGEPVKPQTFEDTQAILNNHFESIKELKEQTDSEKLRTLADWLDAKDRLLGSTENEMQQDLRRIANLLESQPTESGEGEQIKVLQSRIRNLEMEELNYQDTVNELRDKLKQLQSVAPTDEGQEELIMEVISEWSKLPGKPGCMERVKSKFRISRKAKD